MFAPISPLTFGVLETPVSLTGKAVPVDVADAGERVAEARVMTA